MIGASKGFQLRSNCSSMLVRIGEEILPVVPHSCEQQFRRSTLGSCSPAREGTTLNDPTSILWAAFAWVELHSARLLGCIGVSQEQLWARRPQLCPNVSDRAVLPRSRCGLVLSIHIVHKYFSWCRKELPALLLQRNGSRVLLSRPALLLSTFSVSAGMERGVCAEGSCLCRRRQGEGV